MLAAGLSACALVAVAAVVDVEAMEGRVDPGAVFTRGEVGLLAVSAARWAVDGWVEGPGVSVLSAWELLGGTGLDVEGPGVCSAGLCTPVALLVPAVVAAV